jgi:membrane protease YdiL (CAAX protease family)
VPWDFILIFFFLAVILPWRGRIRMKKLLAMPGVSSAERLNLYISTILFQWAAAAFVAWRCNVHGYSFTQLGFVFQHGATLILVSATGSLLVGSFQWFNLRRVSKIPSQSRGLIQAVAERILPRSSPELFPYAALAITAGICEEFLYRGFAMAVLEHLGLQLWLVVILSSILFGLAHSYQGPGGIISTFLAGLLFGSTRVVFGSLVPAVLWHSSVDLIAGMAGPRFLVAENLSGEIAQNEK